LNDQQPTQGLEEESVTFGGLIPDIPEATEDQEPEFSFAPDEERNPAEEIFEIFDPSPPPVYGKIASQRAAKAHFALGDSSPGVDVLLNGIRNRTEESLRQSAAAAEDLKDIQAKYQAIKDKASAGAPVSIQDIREMSAITNYTPKTDPAIVFEKLYGKKYSSSVLSLNNGRNVVNDSFTRNPEFTVGLADVTAELVARQEIVKSAYEDIEAKYQKQGWGSFALDVGKTFMPGYETAKSHSILKAAPKTLNLLNGATIDEKINYLYNLPPAEMKSRLKETLDELAASNVTLAKDFAQKVIGYSTFDKAWDNTFSALDLLGVGMIAKTGYRGVRAVKGMFSGAGDTKAVAGTTITEDALKAAQGAPEATGEVRTAEGVATAEKAMKDAVKANASMNTEAEDILAVMGDVRNSARVSAGKRAKELFGEFDPLNEGVALRGIPTLANPEAVMSGSRVNLSAIATNEILDALRVNTEKFAAAMTGGTSKVPRLPEEALKVAMDEAETILRSRFSSGYTADAIVDVRRIRPDETQTNVGAVALVLGRPDRTGFNSIEEAYQFGKYFYGLEMNPSSDIVAAATIGQQGTGFFLQVVKHLDETTPGVRKALGTSDNVSSQGRIARLLGAFNQNLNVASADSKVSKFQNANRKAAVFGVSGFTRVFEDMIQTVNSLNKSEADALRKVMVDEKYQTTFVTKGKEIRGVFAADQAELESNFSIVVGRLPTDKESKVYWTLRQLNDMEYYMKNLSTYRDKARIGLEKVHILDEETTPDGRVIHFNSGAFDGKFVDDIPWNNPEPAGIVIHRKGERPEYTYQSPSTATDLRQKVKDLKAEGYQVISVDPTRRVMGDRFGNDNVHFIVTKDFTRQALDWHQVPYREGWHSDYENWAFFTKQPGLRKVAKEGDFPAVPAGHTRLYRGIGNNYGPGQGSVTWLTTDINKAKQYGEVHYVDVKNDKDSWKYFSQGANGKDEWISDPNHVAPLLKKYEKQVGNSRHIYDGDVVAAGHRTEPEAIAFAKAMDDARLLLKNGASDADLEKHLQKNLPYQLDDFKKLFQEKTGKDGKPIPPVYSIDEPFKHVQAGRNTADTYRGEFEELYEGFQDNVRSSYNWSQSIDKKHLGQRDDPLQAVEHSGTEQNPVFSFKNAEEVDPLVTVNRAMGNIARNRYLADYKVSQVESWMSQFKDLLVGDKWSIENNPVWHIENPTWNVHADPSRLADAKAARMATMQLLGTHSDAQKAFQNMRQKIVDSVYELGGQQWSDPFSKALIGDGNKAGLDPTSTLRKWTYQLRLGFLNPVPMFQNAVAAGNAIAISPQHGFQGFAAAFAQQNLRIADTPQMRALLSKQISASGGNPKMFLEAWDEFKKTGARVVGNEHTFKDDNGDVRIAEKGLNWVLDKGTMFFKQGELIARMTAWNTAFREFRTANPNVLITDGIRAKILDRADTMNAMMTRASHANYQQGILSVPTQFWSYSSRMMEMTFGKKLTTAEKLRLVAWNSAMYGIPIGTVGTALGGVYDFHKDIKEAGASKAIDTDSWSWTGIMGGMSSIAARLITGNDSAVNEVLGPGGNGFLREVWINDGSLLKALGGASGSVIKDLINSASPGVRGIIQLTRGEESDFPLVLEDALDVLKNIGTIDLMTRSVMAMNAGVLASKKGQVLTDKDDGLNTSEALLHMLTRAEPGRVSSARALQLGRKDIENAQKKLEPEIQKNIVRMMDAMSSENTELAKRYQTRVDTLFRLGGWQQAERQGVMTKALKTKESMVRLERFLAAQRNPEHMELEIKRRDEYQKENQ
jgi:hypothetical protein